VDFREFAGEYRGTLSLSLAPTVFSGTVDVTVTAPRNGKRLNLRTAGYILDPASGNLLSFLGDVTLTASRTVSATNVLFAFAAQIPATGKFTAKKKQTFAIKMSGVVAGETLVGTYDLRFKKGSLSVIGLASSAGNPSYGIKIKARRR